jgi:putative isomerase
MDQFKSLQREYMRGWHTWNVRSVLSQVLMPHGFAINIAVKEFAGGGYLKESLIGRFGKDDEKAFPGPHAYDDSYTKMDIEWRNIRFTVESAADGNELVLLVSVHSRSVRTPVLYLESGFLWNRPGYVKKEGNTLIAHAPDLKMRVYTNMPESEYDGNVPTQSAFLSVPLLDGATFSTERVYSAGEARSLMEKNAMALKKSWEVYGENAPLYEAMQCALAWDTIYDATNDRVISPVSRLWSIGSGGYVLFCWDNYFAGYMSALGCKELSYANLAAITSERTKDGFVPNFVHGTGNKSEDRSQPPVGSKMVLETYRIFKDRWILEMLYPALREWNGWWVDHRMNPSGALCWGSNPRPINYGCIWDSLGVNDTYGAALESGLDNSPMYDDIPFDKETHRLLLEDVGLTGLYILDTEALMEIARILGKAEDAEQLGKRLEHTRAGLETLWDEENGLYYNRRVDTGEFSRRISPTNFYALFDRNVPAERAERMIEEHYKNTDEFYDKYVIPAIARNDPAYHDQDYWRGRIWAPLNFLVYIAFRRHGLDWACADLARKSRELLMNEWLEHGHIHENYNGDTGSGCDVANSDKFYHWGALLGLIAIIEAGGVPGFDEHYDANVNSL